MTKQHEDRITIDVSKPGRYSFEVTCTKQRRRPWQTAWSIARVGPVSKTEPDDRVASLVTFED